MLHQHESECRILGNWNQNKREELGGYILWRRKQMRRNGGGDEEEVAAWREGSWRNTRGDEHLRGVQDWLKVKRNGISFFFGGALRIIERD